MTYSLETGNEQHNGLQRTLARLLRPIARLSLVHGITFAALCELVKRAFVHEAKALQPDMPEHGMVSRISTATGINRREVTRLTQIDASATVAKPSIASEVLARWLTDPSLRKLNGESVVLSRVGEGQSFEALAQLVTRDVHPRSILDELVRLGLVHHDEKDDIVSLASNDFVPKADVQQMLAFLGDNVGDHLEAAVANVTSDPGPHLEQAVFADELSIESVQALQARITAHWRALREDLVPAITELIEADRLAGRAQNQRIRIGLYAFNGADTQDTKRADTRSNRRFRNVAKGKSV
ncbi:MAG: DUF6502 family protein [Geobacter sp.]|nr:DUF6502 family protein [Geobacter sp.]